MTTDELKQALGKAVEQAPDATIAERDARIAELEATVLRQSETIARLEQDNRRQRHLDAMPVDALDRIMYDVSGDLLEEWTQVREWLDSRDGAA